MVTFFIVTKEVERNIVDGERIDSESNKNKNVVMESKVVLILFRAQTEKENTYNVGYGGISSYDDSASYIYKGRWMKYSFIIWLKTIQLYPTNPSLAHSSRSPPPVPLYHIHPTLSYP